MSDVRDVRCASLLMCAWLRSPRAPRALALPIKERFPPAFRRVFLFHSLRSKLCRFLALCLCAFESLRLLHFSLRCSSLCSALSSALLFSEFCYSGLVSASHSSRPTPKYFIYIILLKFVCVVNCKSLI